MDNSFNRLASGFFASLAAMGCLGLISYFSAIGAA